MKQFCVNEETFRTRVQRDGRKLYQCVTCDRVARTRRQHQMPGPTTASHDKTMAILWDSAEQAPGQ